LVQEGDLYNYLLVELQNQGIEMTRDEVKKKLLCDVVAKRKANRFGAEYPSTVEDVFRDLFPTVWAYIREVNCDGWQHKNLIRELQQLESRLVIETVALDLVTRFPGVFFITLHDSIYTTEPYVECVRQAFQRAFDKTGFPMRLKIE
jgi:hypothetical protein